MTTDRQFKKEIQEKKRSYEEKKVDLISRLCAEEPKDRAEQKPLENTKKSK